MPRYNLEFGVSETARVFKVDRDTVKTWAYHFSEHLNKKANPPKGQPRRFTIDDIRVLGYVYYHWDEEPDIESIGIGLNCGNHFEQPFDDQVTILTPIFCELPSELDETWRHGTVLNGMSELADRFSLAESYKLAGDVLVDVALSKDEVFELAYPIIYNYRHATELYLKDIVDPTELDHNLSDLLKKLKEVLIKEFPELDTTLPDWFEDIIHAFNDFDPGSTTFRYGGRFSSLAQDEVWVDLHHLKKLMNWLAEAFNKVKWKRERRFKIC